MKNHETTIPQNAIAIIGMSGKFPKAATIQQFWDNLKSAQNCITYFNDEELKQAGIATNTLRNPKYIKAGGIIDNPDLFDAEFFNFSPKEAEITDPQHRLFLECAWEALETSGHVPQKYTGIIGVYAGMCDSSYLVENNINNLENFLATNHSFLSTKTSYKLGLTGPSININTACSTSLVATILACQSLLNYDCDIAIAGGTGMHFPQQQGYFYEEQGINSADGHCRAFDQDATGLVLGSGIGVVILKRLEDAIADNDSIDAIIRGFAINNDGANKVGFTAPSIEGQASCIASAQALADIDPATISYIETHGTGTKLGDVIEIAALTKVFKAKTNKKQFCAIGSVKTNIGHADTASGITGLIKTILALKNKQIPASLNFKKANPKIDFKNSPFYVNTKLCEWKTTTHPRRAGVSSFGIGGTNAHIILEEAPNTSSERTWQKQFILPLSAKTKAAILQATKNLYDHLKTNKTFYAKQQNFADLVFTLQVGRQDFIYRTAIICQNVNEALQKINTIRKKDIVTIDPNKSQPPLQPNNLPLTQIMDKWLKGSVIQWVNLYAKEKRKRVNLPTYPFAKKSYWLKKERLNEDNNTCQKIEQVPTEATIEQKLTYIWHELLKVSNIGPNDDFFVLGGHSLLAIKLATNIKATFNVDIELQQFYELKTIQQLADYIRTETKQQLTEKNVKTQTAFTKLHPTTQKRPLFIIHPAGGTTFVYLPLIDLLSRDRQYYAIQNKSINAKRNLYSTIEEMAQDYIMEMKKIQPHGPYLLAGYSMGGNVAVEMAHQLQNKSNDVVEAIFLIDAWASYPKLHYNYKHFEKVIQGYNNAMKEQLLENKIENLDSLLKVSWDCQKLMFNYEQAKTESKLYLFKAKDLSSEYLSMKDKYNSWRQYSSQPVTVQSVKGSHSTMLQKNHVSGLAQKMNALLEALD